MATTGVTTCPECESRVREDGIEHVCEQCGLVIGEDRIDRGPEWRSFRDNSEAVRTGAPLTRSRHDRGLSTEIGYSLRLTGRKRRRFARLRREHSRSKFSSKAQRNQVYAFTEIRRLTGALGLPKDIRDRACVLFESAQSARMIRGRTLEGFAAACLYATCRTTEISRTLDEILNAARATEDELKAAYTALNRELGLQTGPIDPREYLPRYATELDLSTTIESRASALLATAVESGELCGRNPSGVAVASLYVVARGTHERITQDQAAAVGGVSTVTIRANYYDLQELQHQS